MRTKIVKYFVLVVGLLASIVITLNVIEEVSTSYTWSVSGTMTTNFTTLEDSTIIVNRVDTTDFVTPVYPDSGDVVIVRGDSTSNTKTAIRKLYRGQPPGAELSFEFLHGNDTLATTIKTSKNRTSEVVVNLILEILRFLGAYGFLLVGFWAFAKRPNSGAIHALTLFSISMGCFLTGSVSIGYGGIRGIEIPYLDQLDPVIQLMSIFFGAFWINLQILFPKPLGYVKKHPYLAHLFIYIPIIIILILSIVFDSNIIAILLTVFIMIQVWGGFIILSRNHAKSKDPLEKRQTRLVLWGSGAGLSGLFIVAAIALFFRSWFIGLGMTVISTFISLVFVGLLIIPISFAYAFGKYRLLEVEGKLRRGTRFAIVTVFLLIIFYGAIYGISETLLNSLGLESRAPALVVALLLAIGFTPAQRKIQVIAESKIFPEKNRLRVMLRDFLSQAVTYANKINFWNDLENHLKDVLKIDGVYSMLFDEDTGQFTNWQNKNTAPFKSDSSFIQELGYLRTCPLMLDEALAAEKFNLSDEEKSWLSERHIAMVLPLQTRSHMVGFIGLGFKFERSDFSAEECSILMSLASQVAVAADNIQLLEDNIEKNRLEKELSMARSVQQGLLPGQIPIVKGLELAAQSRFCLEVAGDYYDVISADENRTVLAIGDVSGKGAAAALLMSNIQASFRTAVSLGTQETGSNSSTHISEMVARINNLIHHNTNSGAFITFFVGVYDANDNSFTYVNAGHNPPMLFRTDGNVELLDKGGLLLGAMPNMPYEQATVKLNIDDLLFLYTDGVSEAENASGDMFGENRIEKMIENNKSLSPNELLNKLENEVTAFIGDIPLSDDYTALVARMIIPD